MPTYEFRCPAGHDFERFYGKISDSPSATPCPECGALAERRISGGAGLLFKGSGFYITDYGKDGKKGQKAAPSGGSEAGADKAGGDKAGADKAGADGGAAKSGSDKGGDKGGAAGGGGAGDKAASSAAPPKKAGGE